MKLSNNLCNFLTPLCFVSGTPSQHQAQLAVAVTPEKKLYLPPESAVSLME
jgi:hypothetical protein